MNKLLKFITVFFFMCITANAQSNTRIITLGTGTPYPSINNQGFATAVVYNNRIFLFDAGTGVMRQINGAGLPISGPEATFITHLHSDHTLGYPDLIFTSWVMRRSKPLEVYGPAGLQKMTDHILHAYSEDIEIRTKGLEKEVMEYLAVNVHEVEEGIVYDSAGVKITAFSVPHGEWEFAYGYRIDTPDKSIVISGDTAPSKNLISAAMNCDILIHEVYPADNLVPENRPGGELWPQYCREYHTSDYELGKIVSEINPKVLILSHVVRLGADDDQIITNIKKGGFTGKIKIANDLDVFQ